MRICDLADKYNALVMIDDCHAVDLWRNGRALRNMRRHGTIDIITGTLGKALGGAS